MTIEPSAKNIKILKLKKGDVTVHESFCENLEELYILSHTDLTNYNFTNLKYLKVQFYHDYRHNFININLKTCPKLEFLYIDIDVFPTYYIEVEDFKTILSIKTLKEIAFAIKDISLLIGVEGENTSVTKLHIKIAIDSINNKCLCEFQNKFPNLKDFIIEKSILEIKECKEDDCVSLIENPKCKVNNIRIKGYQSKDIKLYCDKYEKLTNI